MNFSDWSLFVFFGVLIAGFVMSILTYLSARNHAQTALLSETDAATAKTTEQEALAQLILFCVLLLLGVPAAPAFLIASSR